MIIFLSLENISAQNSDSVKTYVLEETVVTGTRLELKQNKLPVSISIINNSEIQKLHELNVLPLVNNMVPGMFINSRNILGYGVGTASSGEISIRGIGQSPNTGTLVLVDGQPQYMGIFGHPINDSYLKTNVEKIEVIRGPASLLYGSNALGGAINIITARQKREGLSLQSSASYGSFNTSILTGIAGYKNEDFNILASFSNSATDGHRKDGDDDFKSSSFYSQLSYSFNRNLNLSFDGNMTDSKFYDPGTESAPNKDNYFDYTRGRTALAFENRFDKTEGALRLYYNYGEHDFWDGWHSTDNMAGVTLYQSYKFYNENIFTAGVEYKNYGGKGENPALPPFAAVGLNKDISIEELEGYGIFQLNFFKDLNLSAGLRATDNSVYGFEATPQFGFSYILNNSTTIKGNAGKAFRSPSAADLFLFPVSNENLEPERIWSYEMGITRFFMNGRLRGELTFFYLEADNLIQPVQMKKVNTGSFNNKGIELMIAAQPGNAFNANVNYTYLKTSKPLPYAPEHKLNLHLEYDLSIFTISSDLQSIFNLLPEGGIDKTDYTILSLSVGAVINNYLSFFAKGSNLTDKKYYIDTGYPSPGRIFITGLKISFDGI
ncbi:MAG: TonB-dependent receptor [Ignavibacteriaceae bacterium]